MNSETKGIEIAGHRLHQMFVVFPLGLLAGAAAFDVAHVVGNNPQWAQISYWLLVVGVVTALLAAVVGYVDWRGIPHNTNAKGVGAAHGIGNLVVVALFATSWGLRRDTPLDPSGLAVALSIAGAGLAVITGWLGGELVARYGVGVDRGAHVDNGNAAYAGAR